MDLQDLIVFQRVAREGSISRAAASLRFAQPSVSARIRRLEAELGQPLFRRTRRGVELTPAGERLLPYAERCLGLLEEARAAVRGGQEGLRLRLGAPPAVAEAFFPRLIRLLMDRQVAVWARDDHSTQVIEGVLDGRYDAGLILEGPRLPGLAYRVLGQSPLLCVARPDHPLAGKPPGSYDLAELVRHTVIFYPWGEGRDQFWDRLQEALQGEPPCRLVYAAPGELARRLALETGAAAVLPLALCGEDLRADRLVRLQPRNLPASYGWQVALIYRDRKQLDPAMRILLEVVDTAVAQGVAEPVA
ncbi:MAG: LysR family transcriptional regulator [Firmicutes bacterium]|nr:LysR family transcriptional regulator [Bacillota bacterium]